MKKNNIIELPVSELKTALTGLGKVIGRRTTLPVLSQVRITRDHAGQISLQGTDLDSFVTYHTVNVQEGAPVEFLVPMEQLAKTVKTTRDKVNLYPEGKDSVVIQTFVGNTPVEQKVSSLDPKEFPPEPKVTGPAIALPEQARESIVNQAFECASEDESRLIINSVFIDVSDPKAHYVVSTDGRHLFSGNSLRFDLKESVAIPTRKFLGWNGWWPKGSALIAVEPPEMDKKKKEQVKDGHLQLSTDNWTFTTRMVDGKYPNWRQVIPTTEAKTTITIPESAIKTVLDIVARIPGDYEPHYPINILVRGGHLLLQGRNKDQQQPASVPVVDAVVKGEDMTVCLNRHYLAKALRFGLNNIEIIDELSPLTLKAGGKKMIIMPVRMEGPVTVKPKEEQPTESGHATQPATSNAPKEEGTNTNPAPTPAMEPANNNERNNMAKTTTPTTHTETNQENPDSPIKQVMLQIEKIKEGLKSVLHDLNDTLGILKTAEKEQKASDKEIEAVREKLREIQSVTI